MHLPERADACPGTAVWLGAAELRTQRSNCLPLSAGAPCQPLQGGACWRRGAALLLSSAGGKQRLWASDATCMGQKGRPSSAGRDVAALKPQNGALTPAGAYTGLLCWSPSSPAY